MKQRIHEKCQKDKRDRNNQGDYHSGMQNLPVKLSFINGADDRVSHAGNRRDINKIIMGIVMHSFSCG